MGNSGSGSSRVAAGKNYSVNQNGKKHSRRPAENTDDLWITTPANTSVFSELDKHSHAAKVLEDALKSIDEESDSGFEQKNGDVVTKVQNGKVLTGIEGDFNGHNSLRLVAKRKDSLDNHRELQRWEPELKGSKSTEVLTHQKDINDNVYAATLERRNFFKSNPALTAIPFATLERTPPQRTASLRAMRLEAAPWQHQKPSHKDLPQFNGDPSVKPRVKVTRRSTWTPSTSRFKKIFLLNKPVTSSQTMYVAGQGVGDRFYQRTAQGHIVAMSPESTLRTSQWVAQHSHESAGT